MCPVPAHPRFENPIRLATGFDPESLPELSPPVRGVRPWTWLADPDTPDQTRSRYLARHVRGHGTVDHPARELALEPRSRDDVVAGHLSQHVFFEFPGVPGVRSRLSAGPSEVGVGPAPGVDPVAAACDGAVVLFPFAGPVAIVGTTPPAGLAASVVGRRLGEELADFLAGRGIESWDAVAVDSNREWVDHVLLVDCADPGTVFTAAAVHVQPFVSVWRSDPTCPAGIVEVIDLADPLRGRVVARGAADLAAGGSADLPDDPRLLVRGSVRAVRGSVGVPLDHRGDAVGGPPGADDPRARVRHVRRRGDQGVRQEGARQHASGHLDPTRHEHPHPARSSGSPGVRFASSL